MFNVVLSIKIRRNLKNGNSSKVLVEVENFYECVSVIGSAGFCLTKVNIMLKKKENPSKYPKIKGNQARGNSS
jgi:hypothetical protein